MSVHRCRSNENVHLGGEQAWFTNAADNPAEGFRAPANRNMVWPDYARLRIAQNAPSFEPSHPMTVATAVSEGQAFYRFRFT